MRSLPKKTNRLATEQQEVQRAKFRLITRFLAPRKATLSAYFGQPAADQSRTNLAASYHLREAIQGLYPNLQIEYPKVVLTKGELLGPEALTATLQAGAKVTLAWTDNSGQGMAQGTDVLLLFFFNQQRGLWEYREAATRSAATVQQILPHLWTGDTVQCWASFAAVGDTRVANSIYLGGLVLL